MKAAFKTRIATAVLLGSFSFGSVAEAALVDEVSATVERLTEAELALVGETTPLRRIELLQEAIQAFETLRGLSAVPIASPEARQALNMFAHDGVHIDGLRLELAGALLEQLENSRSINVAEDALIKAAILDIENPAYRAAGWTALARHVASHGRALEADRLAGRAVNDAKLIPEVGVREGALEAAAWASNGGIQGRIVVVATDGMRSASRRAGTYRKLARASLPSASDEISATDLLASLSADGSPSNLKATLQAAQALDRDDEHRVELIEAIIDRGISSEAEDLAVEAAKSLDDTSDQEDALRTIIDADIAAGRPLRAIKLVDLLLKSKSRVDASLAIADRLHDDGYEQAAQDVLERAVSIAAEDDRQVRKLAVGLAAAGATAEAISLADTIEQSADRSFAFSRIAKHLADAGDIDRSGALLDEAADPGDRSYAASGVARAFARAGKIDDARALLPSIEGDADRSRALESIAKAEIKIGRLDIGREILTEVKEPAARSRVMVKLALALGKSRKTEAIAVLEAALDALGGEGHDKAVADVAVAFARFGEMPRAERIIGSLKDKEAHDAAADKISKLMTRRQSFREAGDWAARITNTKKRYATLARITLASFREDYNVTRAVDALQNFPYDIRVTALREVAEEQAKTLDRAGYMFDIDDNAVVTTHRTPPAQQSIRANFTLDGHVVQAPAAAAEPPEIPGLPDVTKQTAEGVRKAMRSPSTAESIFYSALLGFSPFDNEAFKLTGKGQPAIYELQVSQALTWPRYIAVEKGVVTLGDILRQMPEATTYRLLERSGDSILVRAPIVVLPKATLLLSGAEFGQYRLSATAGAYISVAGKLHVQDADIVGFDEDANAPAAMSDETREQFRPYIVGWSGSHVALAGSRFSSLGYDARKAYGITLSSGPDSAIRYQAQPPRPTSVIVENSFEEVRYGFYSYEADDVEIIANEYRDNVVYGIDPHDRSRRLIISLNTAYGTREKHGIIISREVDDSYIFGNLSINNEGSGLMLDRSSIRNIVYANTSVENNGDGLTFFESGCNIAVSNALLRNARSGIKARNSDLIGLYDNILVGNGKSAVDVYISELESSSGSSARDFELDPYSAVARVAVGKNQIEANGSGVNVAGASSIILDSNEFVNQRNRLYSGDLLSISSYLLQLGADTSVAVRTTCQPAPIVEACAFKNWHMLREQSRPLTVDATHVAGDCTEVPGSLQENAVARQNTNG